MNRTLFSTLLLSFALTSGGCSVLGLTDDDGGDGGGDGDSPLAVETELLSLINDERLDAGLPELVRDPGMDTVMAFHGGYMAQTQDLTHIDAEGRDSQERARHYGDDPEVRCSEIIQWWGGPPSGMVQYEGYFNSPDHHSAYMEEGIYNLGPTSDAGVAAVLGKGPAGTEFEDRDGTWTGVMFCDRGFEILIDP